MLSGISFEFYVNPELSQAALKQGKIFPANVSSGSEIVIESRITWSVYVL